jgi:hypothetical protein
MMQRKVRFLKSILQVIDHDKVSNALTKTVRNINFECSGLL